MNIGITHVFSCINICRNHRKLLEHEAVRRVFKYLPRGPASVNAMKQTCVIVISFFLIPTQKPTENSAITLKYHFLHWFSPNKMASALNFQML